jgi:hypothetical protein
MPPKYYRLSAMEGMPLRKVEGRLKVHPMPLPSAPSLLNAPSFVNVKAAVRQFVLVGIDEVRPSPEYRNNQQTLKACIEDHMVALFLC